VVTCVARQRAKNFVVVDVREPDEYDAAVFADHVLELRTVEKWRAGATRRREALRRNVPLRRNTASRIRKREGPNERNATRPRTPALQ